MELRNQWLIARQDQDATWQFFEDRGKWTPDLQKAVHFRSLWSAEEAQKFSAAGEGVVRNAADVYRFAASPTGAGSEAAA